VCIGGVIGRIRVGSLRGVAFNSELEVGRVNLITGCNGTFKTTFLEAVCATLLPVSSAEDIPALYGLAKFLRMDDLWLYILAWDGFEVGVDGLVGCSIRGGAELLSVTPPSMPALGYPPVGVKVTADGGGGSDGGASTILRIDVHLTQSGITATIGVKPGLGVVGPRFVALSTPNPITPEFANNLMRLVDYSKAAGATVELLGAGFGGIKPDRFNRPMPVVLAGDRELPPHLLGSGSLAGFLIATLSSRDVVIYDNIESHMHPALLGRVASLIRRSKSQWFISTQSAEALEALLVEFYRAKEMGDVRVFEFTKSHRIHQYSGEDAYRSISELSEDLRGQC